MALAAASLPHQQHEDCNEKKDAITQQQQQQVEMPANVNGNHTKVLINPIAAYSQQLADKQLHIARVTDDGVHWRRKEVADGCKDSLGSKRDTGYFKDKLVNRFSSKSSNTALSGGMLDREFGDDDYKTAAANVQVGDTSRLDGDRAYGAKVPAANASMYFAGTHAQVNGHSNGEVGSLNGNSKASKSNGNVEPPSDKLFKSDTPLPSPSNATTDSHEYYSDTPSAYATPVALAPTPSPLMGYHTPIDTLDTLDSSRQDSKYAGETGIESETVPANSHTLSTLNEAGQMQSSTTDIGPTPSNKPEFPINSSTTLSRQQQDKKTPPPLTALHFLPQANVIPPTPPTASTSASFVGQASTSAASLDTGALQTQQQQPQVIRPTSKVPSSPKSPRSPSSPASSQPPVYLSPESIRKASPAHKRSQSYQPSTAGLRTSTSSVGTSSTTNAPAATPSLAGSQPQRRSSLLPPITTSPVLAGMSADARKRSLSPRRALSFRGSGSGTALPTPGGLLYDEPLSMAEQVEQKRQADQLDETIARQAEQIRKERLSKRIETQRAHEKALASLREEEEARRDRGEDTGASALVSGSPPGREGLPSPMASAASKGKERERGDTTSTAHTSDTLSASPVSVHKQLWSSSPVAGEKAVLRSDSVSAEKTGYAKEKTEVAEPERVLVGNLIGEDHVNYVLMYNMLTGIRIGVSRCEAKFPRPLTDADYTAQHKFSFDIVGNELTPSARYDFKFKDYAPWVFRELRAHFHLDPADYLLSLTAKYILSELGSPGKSGSFFYFSRDYRFIIKTISHTEHKFFRRILKDYHKHVLDNPNTLISRFYGLHRVKLPHGRKIHFVIMNNLFPPHRDVHETFDLKGSSIGREYPEDQAAKKPRATLKDLNWIHRHRQIDFGPYKRHLFEEQLKRDVELLQRLKIMDYSLLIGIHDMGRGNRENLRDGMLTVFSPEGGQGGKLRRRPTHRGDLEREHTAAELRKAVQRADPQTLSHGYQLPQKDQSERRYFVFYQDEGGIRATDEYDRNENTIYYLGVIDILTPYNIKKRIEHIWRSLQYDKHRISAVPPKEYGDRFLNFLLSSVRGGDVSKRPKME